MIKYELKPALTHLNKVVGLLETEFYVLGSDSMTGRGTKIELRNYLTNSVDEKLHAALVRDLNNAIKPVLEKWAKNEEDQAAKILKPILSILE